MKRRTFEEWKVAVDRVVQSLVGVGCDDLPDYGYRAAYDAGMTAHETACEVIEESDMGDGWG